MRVLVFAVCLTVLWAFAADSSRAAERNATASQSTKIRARTDHDVQRVFDKHKGPIFAAYMRALRENPNIEGKLLLSIAIAPDGRVTKCTVASSTLNNPAFEKTMVEHFSGINFGAKGTRVYKNPGFPLEFFAN